MGVALVALGLAGVGCGVILGWFAIWLGGRNEEMAWPFQLGVLAFALLFLIGGVTAIVVGIRARDSD